MTNRINLIIADYSLQLHSKLELELEDGYVPFLSKRENDVHDITVECLSGIPPTLPSNAVLAFEAANETQKFYSIYKLDEGLGFIIYSQQKPNEIQQMALLDESFTQWKVYSIPTEEGKINPMRYPMGPIIMHYLTVKSEAVMIHASCVFDGKKGRIFTGFSGAGKSTISKIWSEAGNQVINDDRLIIRKMDNEYVVYNTPMYYRDISKKAPLDSIFLISHWPENNMKRLGGAMAVSKVMAFCIQNNFDRFFIQNKLNFLADMSLKVSVFELGFVPNASVVDFVLSNENK
jgi:hypothetical protein